MKVDLKNAETPATIVKTSKVLRSHFGSPILQGDYVYGYDESTLKCVKLDTLEEKWSEKKFGKGTLLVVGDLAYVFGDAGNLALAKLKPEKLEIVSEWNTPLLKTRCWTMPVSTARYIPPAASTSAMMARIFVSISLVSAST